MNLEYLRRRAELLETIRAFFRGRGFLEVETPLACSEVIPEAHIEPVRTADGRFLQASPEMRMKRLLCNGSGAVFQICKAFRNDEHGPLHRPEFTILEWYQPGDGMFAHIDFLDEFMQILLGVASCRLTSYRDAFWNACGVDPLNGDRGQLARECEARGGGRANELAGLPRDELLNLLMSKAVEPKLGRDAPEVLYHYPASQAALAATTTDALGVEVAERFELYYRGVELANGYHELTDADQLRERLVCVNDQRVADGRAGLPLPEGLLADMASSSEAGGLPPCAGVALGFDRLVMLAVGADAIGEVIP